MSSDRLCNSKLKTKNSKLPRRTRGKKASRGATFVRRAGWRDLICVQRPDRPACAQLRYNGRARRLRSGLAFALLPPRSDRRLSESKRAHWLRQRHVVDYNMRRSVAQSAVRLNRIG